MARVSALVALVLSSGCSDDLAPQSGMAFATRSVRAEFGHLWEGEVRRHTFRLESVGTEPIRVDQRLDACGCSSVEWFVVNGAGARTPYERGGPIAPGEALEVDVEFDSRGREGDFDQPVSLYVPFENGKVDKIELRLAAAIEPLLEIVGSSGGAPAADAVLRLQSAAAAGSVEARAGRFVDLGNLPPGVGGSAEVELLSRAGPVALRVVGSPIPDVRIDLDPLDADDKHRATRFRLFVSIDPAAPAGVRLGTLQLESDLRGGDDVRVSSFIRVHAHVRSLVECRPAYLDVDMQDAGEPWRRSADVLAQVDPAELAGISAVAVTAVLETPEGEMDFSPWFRGSFETVDGGFSVVLATDGLPVGRFGPFHGVLTVDTGLELQPQLLLHFGGTATGLPGSAAGG